MVAREGRGGRGRVRDRGTRRRASCGGASSAARANRAAGGPPRPIPGDLRDRRRCQDRQCLACRPPCRRVQFALRSLRRSRRRESMWHASHCTGTQQRRGAGTQGAPPSVPPQIRVEGRGRVVVPRARGHGPEGSPPWRDRCPRRDSNSRTRLRRPALYPLSYGGCLISIVVPAAQPALVLAAWMT